MNRTKPEGAYPEFTLPAGADALKPGETREVLAVIQGKPNGRACLTSIDGEAVGSPESPDATESAEPVAAGDEAGGYGEQLEQLAKE